MVVPNSDTMKVVRCVLFAALTSQASGARDTIARDVFVSGTGAGSGDVPDPTKGAGSGDVPDPTKGAGSGKGPDPTKGGSPTEKQGVENKKAVDLANAKLKEVTEVLKKNIINVEQD